MKRDMLSKTLVMSIVVMFISVGIQHAFAVESKTSLDITQNEEDCGCQAVNDINYIKLDRALNRIEIYTRILSLFFKHNPVIKDKFEEVSNKVLLLQEINKELRDDSSLIDNSTICTVLFIFLVELDIFIRLFENLSKMFSDYPILQSIFSDYIVILNYFVDYVLETGEEYDCWENPP